MGIISAARRLESRIAWTSMAAMREFAADELADELHLTPLSAADQIEFACTVAQRLPQTFAALAAGQIHPVHVRIVEDETRFLSEADATRAEAILAEAAPGMTFGELRHAAHKLVLKLDPEVFAGFARGQLLQFQEMGFGVAVALNLDATLIRLVILASTLSLLGQRSWYLPRWLGWLPHLQVEPPQVPSSDEPEAVEAPSPA